MSAWWLLVGASPSVALVLALAIVDRRERREGRRRG